MANAKPNTTEIHVRDSKSGRIVTVRGVGALKCRLTLDKKIDLTKPIASQAIKTRKKAPTASPKP